MTFPSTRREKKKKRRNPRSKAIFSKAKYGEEPNGYCQPLEAAECYNAEKYAAAGGAGPDLTFPHYAVCHEHFPLWRYLQALERGGA